MLSLILILIVLVGGGAFGTGYAVGRNSRRGDKSLNARSVTKVLKAARQMAAVDPSFPHDMALKRSELELALDQYDERQAISS